MSVNVSIIIPVYNVEKYLKKCIDSVLRQRNINTELIIINDGSTDNSHNIIQDYLKKYKNIIYIKQNNQGLSIARNKGIKQAKGKYIMFLDSDDYIEQNSIKEIYEKAVDTDSEIVIFAHKQIYEDSNNKDYIIPVKNLYEDKIYNGEDVSLKLLSSELKGYAWDKMFKTDYIKKNNLEFVPNVYIEDFYPIFKLLYSAEKITFINKPFYNYTQRSNSITNSKSEKLLNDFITSIQSVLNHINTNQLKIPKEIIDAFTIDAFNYILTILYQNKKSKYKIIKQKKYNIYEPTLIQLLSNSYIKNKTKLAIILYKLRIYNILMPSLRRIQQKYRGK